MRSFRTRLAGGFVLRLLLTVGFLSALTRPALAQLVPGKIVRPATLAATRNILDPDGNGYTSRSTSGYTAPDDVSRPVPYTNYFTTGGSANPSYAAPTSGANELPFWPIYPYASEPNSDLRRGPNNRFSDYVPSVLDKASYYMYFDKSRATSATDYANMYLIFRVRMGSIIPGAKGFSYLVDIDGKFGATGPLTDPNYIASTTGTGGNPGFEVEIDLFTQNGSNAIGVAVYNIDGIDQPVPNSPAQRLPASGASCTGCSNNYLDYSQVSVAATSDNGDPDYYIDFYIPFNWLTGLSFSAPTAVTSISTSTPLRIIPTTVMAPQPATGGPKSDIYGLNDALYKDPNAEYSVLLTGMPPFTPDQMTGTGGGTTKLLCTNPPTLNRIATGATSITGSWAPVNVLTGSVGATTAAYAPRAKIYVYRKLSGGVYTLLDTTQYSTITTATTPSTAVNFTVTVPTVVAGSQYYVQARGLDATGLIYTEASPTVCQMTSNTVSVSNCGPSNTPTQPISGTACANPKGFNVKMSNVFTGYTISVFQVNGPNQGNSYQTANGNTTQVNQSYSYTNAVAGGSNVWSGSGQDFGITIPANSAGSATAEWTFLGGCNGPGLSDGTYRVTYTNTASGCASSPLYLCIGSTTAAGAFSITSPAGINAIKSTTTSITGSIAGANNTTTQYTVALYKNGESLTTATTDAAGSFTFSSLSFSSTDEIYFAYYRTGLTATCAATSSTVKFGCKPVAPAINSTDAGVLSTNGTTISGTSSEYGATVTIYTAATNVTASNGVPTTTVTTTPVTVTTSATDGTWTATVTLVNGNYYWATVTNTSGCTSSFASSGIQYAGTATTARCPAVNNISATYFANGQTSPALNPFVQTLTINNIVSGAAAKVYLFQDNLLLGSTDLALNATSVTFSNPGFFIPNASASGYMTIQIAESGKTPQSCFGTTYQVTGCSGSNAISAFTMTLSACTSCGSPINFSNLVTGSTATFSIDPNTPGTLSTATTYGIRQQTVGTQYSNPFYNAANSTSLSLTTFPIALPATSPFVLETVGTKVVSGTDANGNVVGNYSCSNQISISGAVVTTTKVLSGTVYNDWDGLNGAGTMSDGTGTGSVTPVGGGSPAQLYVYLVSNGLVVSRSTVGTDGKYSVSGIATNTAYSLILSSASVSNGGALSASSLPTGWASTAEGTAYTSGDGTVNGIYAVTAGTTGGQIDFGLNASPTGYAKSYTLSWINNSLVQTVSTASKATAGVTSGVTYKGAVAVSNVATNTGYDPSIPGLLTGDDINGSATGTGNLTLRNAVSDNYLVINPANYAGVTSGVSNQNAVMLAYNGVQLQPGGCQGTDVGSTECSYYNSSTSRWEIPAYDYTLMKMLVREKTTGYSFQYAWKDYAGVTGSAVQYAVNFSSPLPLRLLQFEAKAVEPASVQLDWRTAAEENTERFAVEHSRDGQSFSEIGSVGASGNAASATYSFVHRNAPAGVNYYRLRMIDRDAHYTYSMVRHATLGNNDGFIGIAPNPAASGNSTQLSWRLDGAGTATIRVRNAAGVPVLLRTGVSGSSFSLPTTGLPAGIYNVQVERAGKSVQQRLVIQ